MRTKRHIFFLAAICSISSNALADSLKLGGISMSPSLPGTLFVDYTGPLPTDENEYKDGYHWHVQWQQTSEGPVTSVDVASGATDP